MLLYFADTVQRQSNIKSTGRLPGATVSRASWSRNRQNCHITQGCLMALLAMIASPPWAGVKSRRTPHIADQVSLEQCNFIVAEMVKFPKSEGSKTQSHSFFLARVQFKPVAPQPASRHQVRTSKASLRLLEAEYYHQDANNISPHSDRWFLLAVPYKCETGESTKLCGIPHSRGWAWDL